MVLSLGYDMTQAFFAGIVTSLVGKRPAQAMGLNVFTLFTGFGLGSLIFNGLPQFGFAIAFGVFAATEALAASLWLFRRPSARTGLRIPLWHRRRYCRNSCWLFLPLHVLLRSPGRPGDPNVACLQRPRELSLTSTLRSRPQPRSEGNRPAVAA